MFIRTERLFLRPAWPEDLDDLVRTIAEDGLEPTVGVAPLPKTLGEIRVYLEQQRDPRLPHYFMYLRAPGGPQLVGGIGLDPFEGDDGGVEIGYWIAPRFRGRGFGREALRAVLDQARSFGYCRIVASHFAESLATHRVLESVGFHDTDQVQSRYDASHGMEFSAHFYVADLAERPPVPMAPLRVRAPEEEPALTA